MSSIRWRDWPLPRRLAAAALAAALLLDLAVLLRFRHVEDAEPRPLAIASPPKIVRRAADDEGLRLESQRRDPFGGTEAPSGPSFNTTASVAQQSVTTFDRPRLIGTVIEGEARGFVMVEMPDSRIQVVRIGERAGSLRLISVSAGAALFQDEHGARITLRSPQAGTGARQ